MHKESGITRSTLIDLNPDELTCYLFVVNIDGCNGSCNTLDDFDKLLMTHDKNVNTSETVPTSTNKPDYCLIYTILLVFMCLLLLIIIDIN